MNKIFRIVFNTTTGRWVVASEMAKGRKKASASGKVGAAMAATLVTALAASGIASAGSVDGGTATGSNSVSVGPGSTAVTGGTAVGANAKSTATDGTAVGQEVVASGVNSTAMGNQVEAQGDGSIAIQGNGSQTVATDSTSTNAIAIGTNALVTNAVSGIAFGYNAASSASRAIAVGDAAKASASNGLALGASANASANNSVALGAGSTTTADLTAAAFNPISKTLVGTASPANGEVSIGHAGAERRLTNLAAGSADTDAVNVSQLKAVDNQSDWIGLQLAAKLGGGASFDTVTNGMVSPSYTLTNSNALGGTTGDARNVGAGFTKVDNALGNLDGRVTTVEGNVANNTTNINNLLTGQAGLVQQAAAGQKLTMGKDTDGAAVDITGTAGTRMLTGLTAGTVAAGSTDGVNGSQLYGLANSTSTALGGGSTVNPDGSITAPSYTVGGTTVTNVGDAITNIDGRTTSNTTAITNLTNGTAGLVQQAGPGQKLTVGKGTDGSEVDFANSAGLARKLTRVAAGSSAEDAVNVSQLKPVVDGLGGGATIDPVTGLVTGPTYHLTNVDGTQTTVTNVGDAITNIDGRTATNTTNIAGNTTAINNITTNISNGTVGPVQRTAAGQLSLVAAGGDATAPGAAQVLTNVAKGAVNAGSTDAVNGSQLFALADSTSDALGGGSTVNPDGSITAPNYTVGGTTVTNVGDAITNIDGRTTSNTDAITNITNTINNGTVGLVQQAGPGQKLTVGKGTDGSEVDFANNAGLARKLTRVAAGSSAEDAVNVSQLKPVVDGLGGGATIDPVTGLVTGPTYHLTNVDGTQTTVNNVGDAITNIDGRTATNTTNIANIDDRTTSNTTAINNISTNISNGTLGPVQRTATGQLSLIAVGGDATAPGAAQVLTNVAKGSVNANSADAINGSQLFALADSTSDALGGGSTVNPDGSITAPSYTVGNTTVNNVGDAISNIDGRTTQNTTDIAGNTTAINNITTSITNGTLGLVQQAGPGQKLTVGKGTDGSEVDFANNAGRARKLTRVAAGTDGEDAVNVSQLKPVVDGLGGGASIDPVTGLVTGPTYHLTNVDGTQSTVNNVGDAITNIDGRVYSNTTQITHLTNQISTGTVGLVQQAGPGQKLTVGKDTDGSEVSFANAAGQARKLSDVANGSVTETSTDAVNGSQLHAVSKSLTTALGGGSTVNADGTISAPTYTLTNADGTKSDVTGVEGAITNLDGRTHNNTVRIDNVETNVNNLTNQINSGAVGLVQQAAPGQQLTVGKATDGTSVNFAGTDGDRALTGVAAGKADNDAVNMGQLKAAGVVDDKGEARAVVAYDSHDKTSVTLGGEGATKPVAMHNVAAGVSDFDAVNVSQLNARLQAQSDTILQQANNYADDRFNSAMGAVDDLRSDVDDRFHVQDARIDRLSAMSSAMANMTASMSGVRRENRIGVGAGTTNGRLAMAVGYQRAFREDGATLTAGASFTDEDTTIGVGAGFGW